MSEVGQNDILKTLQMYNNSSFAVKDAKPGLEDINKKICDIVRNTSPLKRQGVVKKIIEAVKQEPGERISIEKFHKIVDASVVHSPPEHTDKAANQKMQSQQIQRGVAQTPPQTTSQSAPLPTPTQASPKNISSEPLTKSAPAPVSPRVQTPLPAKSEKTETVKSKQTPPSNEIYSKLKALLPPNNIFNPSNVKEISEKFQTVLPTMTNKDLKEASKGYELWILAEAMPGVFANTMDAEQLRILAGNHDRHDTMLKIIEKFQESDSQLYEKLEGIASEASPQIELPLRAAARKIVGVESETHEDRNAAPLKWANYDNILQHINNNISELPVRKGREKASQFADYLLGKHGDLAENSPLNSDEIQKLRIETENAKDLKEVESVKTKLTDLYNKLPKEAKNTATNSGKKWATDEVEKPSLEVVVQKTWQNQEIDEFLKTTLKDSEALRARSELNKMDGETIKMLTSKLATTGRPPTPLESYWAVESKAIVGSEVANERESRLNRVKIVLENMNDDQLSASATLPKFLNILQDTINHFTKTAAEVLTANQLKIIGDDQGAASNPERIKTLTVLVENLVIDLDEKDPADVKAQKETTLREKLDSVKPFTTQAKNDKIDSLKERKNLKNKHDAKLLQLNSRMGGLKANLGKKT